MKADELAALTMTGKLVSKKKSFDLGSTRGAVGPGGPSVLELKLSKKAIVAVKKSGGVAKLSLTGTDAGGAKSVLEATVTAKKSSTRKR